jgi:hypothetical protein
MIQISASANSRLSGAISLKRIAYSFNVYRFAD